MPPSLSPRDPIYNFLDKSALRAPAIRFQVSTQTQAQTQKQTHLVLTHRQGQSYTCRPKPTHPHPHPTQPMYKYTQYTHSPNCSFFGYVQCFECSGICIYLEWRHQSIFETLTVIASCPIGLKLCLCFSSDTKMKIVCVCRLFLLSFGKEVGTVDTYTYRLIAN